MGFTYFDIETVPLDKGAYLSADEAGRKKLMNPIDSRIIAIGAKRENVGTLIIQGENEKELLEKFWGELKKNLAGDRANRLVGFNVKEFDLPFLVTRSFITNAKIVPFVLKEVIDIREYLAAFKFGHTRGKLKELAELIGIRLVEGMDGEKIAETHWAGEHAKIEEYLRKDIEITEAIHKRMIELRITEIQKW